MDGVKEDMKLDGVGGDSGEEGEVEADEEEERRYLRSLS